MYFNLGNAYYRNNELGKGIYYYELARKVNPNDDDVRINLGIAYRDLKEYDNSINILKEAQKIYPDHPYLRTGKNTLQL